jgi:transcriptional regulator with XRE-family HTH domain
MNPRERFLVESSMVQIVQDWLEKLHGSEEEAQTSDERKLKEQDLAKVLGVHKTTLWRWQQPETGAKSMRPSLERLRLYDDVVLARLLVLKGIAPA